MIFIFILKRENFFNEMHRVMILRINSIIALLWKINYEIADFVGFGKKIFRCIIKRNHKKKSYTTSTIDDKKEFHFDFPVLHYVDEEW